MKAYVKLNNNNSVYEYATCNLDGTFNEVFQEDPVINFDKLQAYTVVFNDETQTNHLKYDEEKYNEYLEEEKKKQAISEGNKLAEELVQKSILDNATDAEAFVMRYLYSEWSGDRITYKMNDRLMYNDKFYKVLQDHTSQSDWTPDTASSLYVEIADPSNEYPEFVQPSGAHDAYAKGDSVTFEGKHYISLIDANVYSPTAYPTGWSLVE